MNKKCAIAILIALEVFEFNVAAINAVTVVPIFAPMINGAACFRLVIFLATIGTTTEVVIVLERMAAVVIRPHAKDLSWFLKKNRLNTSGDFAFNKFEISLLKIKIDENNKTNEMTAIKNGLGIFANKKSMIGANPNQKWETLFLTGVKDGVKKKLAIHTDNVDKNP